MLIFLAFAPFDGQEMVMCDKFYQKIDFLGGIKDVLDFFF